MRLIFPKRIIVESSPSFEKISPLKNKAPIKIPSKEIGEPKILDRGESVAPSQFRNEPRSHNEPDGLGNELEKC